MFLTKSLIKLFVFLTIMLLPVAHWKTIIFGVPLYSVEIPVLAALFVYLYGWHQGEFLPLRKVNLYHPLAVAMAFFFLGALLSFVANPFSWTGLGMLKTWFVLPILMLGLWTETEPEESDLKRLLLVWLGVSVLSAMASLIYLWQGVLTYDGRLAAWYGSPNYLAFFLAPGVLLAGYFISLPSLAKRGTLIYFWGAFFVIGAAIFCTGSYAAMAGVFLALAVYFYLSYAGEISAGRKILFVVLLLGLFSTFVFLEYDSEKWRSLITFSERSSLASRIMIWQSAAKIISDYPIFGIGLGRFQVMYLAYQKYFPFYLEWAVPEPHNLLLAVWLQTGLLGLASFVFLIIYGLTKMFGLWRFGAQNKDEYIKKLSALLVSLATLFLLLGVVDTPFFKTDLAFIFWLILALGIGFWNQRSIR